MMSLPVCREDVAAAGGGAGVPGRRAAVSGPDAAVEAVPGAALLPLAVQRLVRVPGGGTSIHHQTAERRSDSSLTQAGSIRSRVAAKKWIFLLEDRNLGIW